MTPARMAALHAASFARGWTETEITDLLARPTTLAVTAERGFALLQVIPPEAEILTMITDPDLRGQGHGQALLGQALLAAARHGATAMYLEVDATNTSARALYDRAGFLQTGLRKGYYLYPDGSRTDAIMMSRAVP